MTPEQEEARRDENEACAAVVMRPWTCDECFSPHREEWKAICCCATDRAIEKGGFIAIEGWAPGRDGALGQHLNLLAILLSLISLLSLGFFVWSVQRTEEPSPISQHQTKP